ncbi:MAG: hypothetical protein AAGL89_06190 [Pseudomonadota bacterium]
MQTFFTTAPPIFYEAIGILGFTLYVGNYLLLTLHWVTSHSAAYFMINLAAATCVLISLTQTFNLASALIQMFWIVMSITAIMLRLKRRATPSSAAHVDFDPA